MVFVLWFTFFFREKARIFFQVRVLVITKAKRKKICKKKEMSIMSSWKAKRAWLLKCCKNKSSYDMKIYFHSIKIILYLIKHIFIISPFCWWHQNKFSFNQNKFVFNKIYFHYITPFFMISKYIFIHSEWISIR